MPDLWARAKRKWFAILEWNVSAYCHFPVEQNQNEKQKDSSWTRHTKEVGGILVLLGKPLFGSDMPHRLLLRVL